MTIPPGFAPLLWALFFLATFLLTACSSAGDGRTQPVDLAGRTFNLEIADNPDGRFKGLSDRKSIADDGGMLFVFPDLGERTFVMRRCPIPIDIVFLDGTGRIVAMHEMQPEPADTGEDQLKRYPSDWPAQFAIELRGGALRRLKLTMNQKIPLPLAELKRRAR